MYTEVYTSYINIDATVKTISLTEARKCIFDLAEQVQTPDNFYILTERGKPKAALISYADFESIIETLAALKDFPDLPEEAERSHEDMRSGRYWVLTEHMGNN